MAIRKSLIIRCLQGLGDNILVSPFAGRAAEQWPGQVYLETCYPQVHLWRWPALRYLIPAGHGLPLAERNVEQCPQLYFSPRPINGETTIIDLKPRALGDPNESFYGRLVRHWEKLFGAPFPVTDFGLLLPPYLRAAGHTWFKRNTERTYAVIQLPTILMGAEIPDRLPEPSKYAVAAKALADEGYTLIMFSREEPEIETLAPGFDEVERLADQRISVPERGEMGIEELLGLYAAADAILTPPCYAQMLGIALRIPTQCVYGGHYPDSILTDPRMGLGRYTALKAQSLRPVTLPAQSARSDRSDGSDRSRAIPPATVTIAVPPGIGDSLWSMVKVPAIRAQYPNAKIVVVVQDCGAMNRSQEFLEAFDFVDEVRFGRMQITRPDEPQVNEDGSYNYVDSGRNVLGYDYWLCANGALERGQTLDEWLPDIPTDWDIAQRWKLGPSGEKLRESMRNQTPYVVFYPGPDAGNMGMEGEGQNRGSYWRIDDWVLLARSLVHEYGLNVILVGANWDQDMTYAGRLIDRLSSFESRVINLVGTTTVHEAFAVCQAAKAIIGYPAGISIFSCWLGVPAVMWQRAYGDSIHPRRLVSFSERMKRNMMPPYVYERESYIPLVYGRCTAASIIEDMRRRRWISPTNPTDPANPSDPEFPIDIEHVPANAWMPFLVRRFRETMKIPGDVAEVGCYLGGTALRMATLVNGQPKKVWAFDTFSGFAKDDPTPGAATKAGKYRPPYNALADLQSYASRLPIVPVQGDVFETIKPGTTEERAYSFAVLDTDTEETIRHELAYFAPRMSPGGIIAIDDYGRPECPGAKLAVDQFIYQNQGWQIIDLDPYAFQIFLRRRLDEIR